MISKILCATLLVAYAESLQEHGIASSLTFNQHQNTIHNPHIQSAPAFIKTIPAPVHAAPLALRVASPLYATPHIQGSSYALPSLASGHAGRYTAPISSLSFAQHAVPSIQYASPATRVATPVFLGASGPSHHASSYSSLSSGHGYAAAPLTRVVTPIAAPVLHSAPAVHAVPVAHVGAGPSVHASGHYEEYAHPKYEFAYGVEDHHTGDIHSHKEVRDGDLTQGEYSLHEADGTIRTVKYSVDKHSGFNAVVERSGHATHAQPVPVHKAVVAAPVLTKTLVSAPAYSAYHH